MPHRDAIPKTQAAYINWHDTLKLNVTTTTPGVVLPPFPAGPGPWPNERQSRDLAW